MGPARAGVPPSPRAGVSLGGSGSPRITLEADAIDSSGRPSDGCTVACVPWDRFAAARGLPVRRAFGSPHHEPASGEGEQPMSKRCVQPAACSKAGGLLLFLFISGLGLSGQVLGMPRSAPPSCLQCC